jgi:hypothetical protein
MDHTRMVGRLAGWFGVGLFLAGCFADVAHVQLNTFPQVSATEAIGTVYVGPFVDRRQDGNVDTTILGTLRGGYGNPLARIRHAGGAGEFVRDQVINAARAHQIVADPTPEAVGIQQAGSGWVLGTPAVSDRLILVGRINQLIVEAGYSKGTLIDVSLELLDPMRPSSPRVWNGVVADAQRTGHSFASPTDLKRWLGESLVTATVKTLSSSDFAAALQTRR